MKNVKVFLEELKDKAGKLWYHGDEETASKYREMADRLTAAINKDEMPVDCEILGHTKKRTKAQVLAARAVPHSGCCERYCDMKACNCLEEAV